MADIVTIDVVPRVQCGFIAPGDNNLPGWACCLCLIYNGLQRETCRICGHYCCLPNKPQASDFGLCDVCGVPGDANYHLGH